MNDQNELNMYAKFVERQTMNCYQLLLQMSLLLRLVMAPRSCCKTWNMNMPKKFIS
jgi:hypothetical protein